MEPQFAIAFATTFGIVQCFFLCFKFVAQVARGCDKAKLLWLFAKKSM
jgi:hypothetical protein